MSAEQWLFNRLTDEINENRRQVQAFTDRLKKMHQASIPQYLTQLYQFNPNALSITLNKQTNGLCLVESVIFQFGSGDATTPAVLQLGDKTWTFTSVPSTPVVWTNLALVLKSGDVLSLSQKTAGPLSLLIMGKDLAEQGVF